MVQALPKSHARYDLRQRPGNNLNPQVRITDATDPRGAGQRSSGSREQEETHRELTSTQGTAGTLRPREPLEDEASIHTSSSTVSITEEPAVPEVQVGRQSLWITEVLRDELPVMIHPSGQQALEEHPERETLLSVLLGWERLQVLPEVNRMLVSIQSSPLPQQVQMEQFRQAIHPELQPLLSKVRWAFVRGFLNLKRLRRRQATVEDWTHHGIQKLLRPIKSLTVVITELTQGEDKTLLDGQLDQLHRNIAESVIRRRNTDPALQPRYTILKAMEPLLLQVERVVRGQLNAKLLVEKFLATIEVQMLLQVVPGHATPVRQRPAGEGQDAESQPLAGPPRQ